MQGQIFSGDLAILAILAISAIVVKTAKKAKIQVIFQVTSTTDLNY
jgi:hypothetical protein